MTAPSVMDCFRGTCDWTWRARDGEFSGPPGTWTWTVDAALYDGRAIAAYVPVGDDWAAFRPAGL